MEISGYCSLFISLNDRFNSSKAFEFIFSARIDENSHWLDETLGLDFLNFLQKKIPQSLKRISSLNLKTSEIFIFLLCHLINQNPTNFPIYFEIFSSYFASYDNDITSFRIFSVFAVKYGDFNLLLTNNVFNSFLQKEFGNGSINKEDIIRTFSQTLFNFFETLSNFSANVSEAFNLSFQRVIKDLSILYDLFSVSSNVDFSSIIQKQRKEFSYSLQVLTSLAAKSHRRIIRSLSSHATTHFRLNIRADRFYRHVFMRANYKFDVHRIASVKRDQSHSTEAQREYQRWIELQSNLPELESEQDVQINYQRASKIQIESKLITIGMIFQGNLYLTDTELIFDGNQVNEEFTFSIDGSSAKTIEFKLFDLEWVLHRKYLHVDDGLEFFLRNGRSYFFFFQPNQRKIILKFLKNCHPPNLQILQFAQTSATLFNEQKFTQKWENREISTYQYLMLVNFFSGRSFNDLSQYPVFPWVLSDFKSEKLDLNNPNVYRDLSKNIGSLNSSRLEKLKMYFDECPEGPQKTLFRTHYSTAYYVLHYLIRIEPFTTLHISMQDGKFDHTNRSFTSIAKTFHSCSGEANDFRELIPEFFTLPDMFVNSNQFDLGTQNDGHVVLPPWAKSSYDFIQKHQKAIESDIVGSAIGNLIDLIFGIKQDGENAVEANNVFHKYCYSSSLSQTKDPLEINEIRAHAGSFGIIPDRLFNSKHINRKKKVSQNNSQSSFLSIQKFQYS